MKIGSSAIRSFIIFRYSKFIRSPYPESLIFGSLLYFLFSTFSRGFDWGDMGLYAQTIYELRLGANPTDFLGYGPLWYYLGQIALFGRPVDYGTLLLMMQVVIIASAALIFAASRIATRSTLAATAAVACFVLVPPFSAYVIRSITLGLFLLPFVMLARAPLREDRLAFVLTALAVSVVFQMRPDFGLLYLGLAICLIVARIWFSDANWKAAATNAAQQTAVFITLTLVTLVPIAVFAAARGYLVPLLDNWATFPRAILFFLLNSSDFAKMGGSSDGQQSSLMRILPISALFGSDGRERVFAFLIYSTAPLLFGIGVAWVISALRGKGRRPDFVLLALFLVAAVQWPFFAIFRPGWAHFVAFAHAYALLLAYVVTCAWTSLRAGQGMLRKASVVTLLVLALAQCTAYLSYGMTEPSMSWLALRAKRDQPFKAGNGVNLLLNSSERSLYGKVFRTVQAGSAPGDTMVCVPYCAGLVFMNERRMLFRKQAFVDDSTPRQYPGWIDRAIEVTRQERPAAIIVLDWAPNNTPASRFEVWAARYMDYVRATYHPVLFGMGTIWLRDPPAQPKVDASSETVRVLRYGPETATVGVAFNAQPDGSSAIWMELSGPVSDDTTLYLGGKPLKTFVNGAMVTALVPNDLIAEPGTIDLRVVDDSGNRFSEPVTLTLRPK